MIIQKYYPKHSVNIQKWLKQHSLAADLIANLPRIGFMASHKKQPIAIGFIRQCEGDFCIMDSFITNPLSSSNLRHQALVAITDKLITEAKANNLKYILAFTDDKSIVSRATRHGFTTKPHSIIGLDLSTSIKGIS